jgi:predicted TIM-barrel fold metal-dependent hydrolase
MNPLSRRNFLTSATLAVSAAAKRAEAQSPTIPIIDTHIHLFDQTRPQGAPYAGNAGNTTPALPPLYRSLIPAGIVGAIEIEASPWVEDNLWVLEVEATDTIMVGYIGNLQPDKPEFTEYLGRYHKNPLFLGIRYGNLWGYDLVSQLSNPTFVNGLKMLQQADLTLDTANQNMSLLQAAVQVTNMVPGLRIVVDHLPAFIKTLNSAGMATVDPILKQLAQSPTVWVKVSELLSVDANMMPITDPAFYKPTLDYIFGTFGEDKVLFGSDWPNSIAATNLPAVLQIVQDYFYAKGTSTAEKYFWRNSVAAYKWVRREYSQPPSAAATKQTIAMVTPQNLTTSMTQVTLDASSSLSANGALTYTYSVAAGGLAAAILQSSPSTPQAIVQFVNGPGTYKLTLTVTDAGGKTSMAPITLIYKPS